MKAVFEDFDGIHSTAGRTGGRQVGAWAESFRSVLKNEIAPDGVPTRQKTHPDIASWIELRHSRKRFHSSLGYRTPDESRLLGRNTAA